MPPLTDAAGRRHWQPGKSAKLRYPTAGGAAPRPVTGHPTETHLYLHGVPGEDIAAILIRQVLPGPDANQSGPARPTRSSGVWPSVGVKPLSGRGDCCTVVTE